MFVIGFITTFYSILHISKILLAKESFKFVLTYKFSQDHLELFFSSVRARSGFNNNPNVIQFKYALRKLLFTKNIVSGNGNCFVSDEPDDVLDFKSYNDENVNIQEDVNLEFV